ncbi:long-chain fatty acid--CoA ligase [Lottiidibacillus patelloidae]|uniref:Long-chain fatty acid--CoA ligase n=1 Tax=Lottiidibacillus patelloidae TaxID=2670334 RepID=A0A263BW06_9BACI|nr:long-chain-fatty-acid--CoA ligase [Lottiidibacillus patelloidae]OZM57919.1 long-chain fatty acid--CoA ligase [Lottiidibacillus patelloidae]
MNPENKPWLSFYPDEIPKSINYEEKPLHYFLKRAASENPDAKAITFYGTNMTYKQLYEQTCAFANELHSLGLGKGDRVSIMLPNCPQAVISYYAILMIGGIVVQTNPTYVERELRYQMNDSQAKAIICLDLLYPRVQKVKADTTLQHVIVTSVKDYLPFPKNMLYPIKQKKEYGVIVHVEYSSRVHAFKKLVKSGDKQEFMIDIDPKKDLALLQYTGGTTGFPKGVMLTHYNLVANTQQASSWMYKLKKGKEKILGILPFFHVYGMTVVMNFAVMANSHMILLAKFDPTETLKTIAKQKPTIFPGAPTIYIALLNHPQISKYDISSINACLSGSAPLPVEVQDKFEKVTGGKLVEGYGLTEASPVTHANLLWGHRVKGSVGIPWPDTIAAIISPETKEPVPTGTIGEIAVKGPQIMQGYWNRKDETEKVFHGDWLLTGDLGYADKDGYFYIVDRKKDMIIAGGYNIYPREVEEVLYEHDAILEAAVVGIKDEYRGETVKAFLVLKDGKSVTEEELNNFCRKHLASYKVPRAYEFRDELPKTTIGKILRRVLIEEEEEKVKS